MNTNLTPSASSNEPESNQNHDSSANLRHGYESIANIDIKKEINEENSSDEDKTSSDEEEPESPQKINVSNQVPT
jgi:hypothetical protein